MTARHDAEAGSLVSPTAHGRTCGATSDRHEIADWCIDS